jgi:microcystin-dependent protein
METQAQQRQSVRPVLIDTLDQSFGNSSRGIKRERNHRRNVYICLVINGVLIIALIIALGTLFSEYQKLLDRVSALESANALGMKEVPSEFRTQANLTVVENELKGLKAFYSQLNQSISSDTELITSHVKLLQRNDANQTNMLYSIFQGNFNGAVPSGAILMWRGSIIPSGWKICNGSNNTPDLRRRFIVGAGNGYALDDVGGQDSVTLQVSQIPQHKHTSTMIRQNAGFLGRGTTSQAWDTVSAGISQNTSSVGGGLPHENRPPYYALLFIMKI